MGDPHSAQKLRRTPGDEAYSFGVPRVKRSAARGTITNVATGDDVCRRQLSQWQWIARSGSSAYSYWIAPHRQCPVVVIVRE
jgi:hypothetical protein